MTVIVVSYPFLKDTKVHCLTVSIGGGRRNGCVLKAPRQEKYCLFSTFKRNACCACGYLFFFFPLYASPGIPVKGGKGNIGLNW